MVTFPVSHPLLGTVPTPQGQAQRAMFSGLFCALSLSVLPDKRPFFWQQRAVSGTTSLKTFCERKPLVPNWDNSPEASAVRGPQLGTSLARQIGSHRNG